MPNVQHSQNVEQMLLPTTNVKQILFGIIRTCLHVASKQCNSLSEFQTFGMTSTRSGHTPTHRIAISAETCHENRASMQRTETQIPMSQPHPTTQKTADLTKRCACAEKSSILQHLTFPHGSSLFHTNLTRHASMQNPLHKLPPMAVPYRSTAGGCER